MFKTSGIDLSDPNSMSGPSRMSGPQLRFFCSVFGSMSAERVNEFKSCSRESANLLITGNTVCHRDGGSSGSFKAGSAADSNAVAGDRSKDRESVSSDAGRVSKDELLKCNKPTTASKRNCKKENRAKVNGVCGAQLVGDCVRKDLESCDDIQVSLQTCQYKHLMKDSDSKCYKHVETVCQKQKNDGAYTQPFNALSIHTFLPVHPHCLLLMHRVFMYPLSHVCMSRCIHAFIHYTCVPRLSTSGSRLVSDLGVLVAIGLFKSRACLLKSRSQRR